MYQIKLKPEGGKSKAFKLATGAVLYPGFVYTMTELPPEVSEKPDMFETKEISREEVAPSRRQRRKQIGG